MQILSFFPYVTKDKFFDIFSHLREKERALPLGAVSCIGPGHKLHPLGGPSKSLGLSRPVPLRVCPRGVRVFVS